MRRLGFFGGDVNTRCPSNSNWGSGSVRTMFEGSNSWSSTNFPATIWLCSYYFLAISLHFYYLFIVKSKQFDKNINLWSASFNWSLEYCQHTCRIYRATGTGKVCMTFVLLLFPPLMKLFSSFFSPPQFTFSTFLSRNLTVAFPLIVDRTITTP